MVKSSIALAGVPPIELVCDDEEDTIKAISIQQGENIVWIPLSEFQKFTAAFDVFKASKEN